MSQNQNEPTTINDEFYEDTVEPESSLGIQQELDERLEGDLEFIRKHGRVVSRTIGALYSEIGRAPTAEEIAEFVESLALLEDYYKDSLAAISEAREMFAHLIRKGS